MKRLVVLKNGLEASSILLSIMTAPSVDRRVISEECIESCITLTRQCLYKNIIPAITSTGHLAFAGSEEPTPKKQKKTKPETKQQGLMKSLKQVYTYILASSDLFLGVLERMDALVQVIALEDGMVLTLATTALSVFPVEPSVATQARTCHSLHVASISLLTTIFQKYPRHRTIILEDLFPLLLKLPTSKKSLRTFCVHTESDVVTVKRALHHHHGGGSEQDSIQAITALILSLIQCSVEMPFFQSTDEEQDEETTLKSGLGQCQAVCHFFATQLLQRCAKRGQDGGASEFRPILGNLVDDLLLLLLSPEYPSASMLLLIMNRILANDMLKASSIVPKTAGTPHAEATYLNTAFDVLGKISAAAAGILAAYRDKPLKIASEQDNGASSAKVESSCHCGRSHTQQFMVNCDDCKGWYHGECVCLTKTNVPRVWICDDCRLKRMVVEETRVFAERSKRTQPKGMDLCLSECVSDTHILRQLLLNHLTEESSSTLDSPARQFARKVHLAMWIEELNAPQATGTDTEDSDRAKNEFVSRLLCDHFLQQWDASEGDVQAAKNDHTVGSSSRRCLNKEGNMRLMLNLTATKSGLVTSFPRQIGLLLQLMADEAQTSVRKLSVKAISQVIILFCLDFIVC
jgi:cohesin loading factor subunit SCC2